MTDTDRLASALASIGYHDHETDDFVMRGDHVSVAESLLTADPTLICPDPDAHRTENGAESLRRERMLAEALRDAIDVAHETDSLRNHSDDERKDGWFRAPLYRCTDVTCEQANEALRQHDDAINPIPPDTDDDR